MNQRNYYYLVAGLPDILLEQPKPPFSSLQYREDLRHHLHPDDYRQVELLFLFFDNRNLLHILEKKEGQWDERGNFPIETLDAGIRDGEGLPSYMHRFIQAYQQELPLQPNMSWENQLADLYFEYGIQHAQGFPHRWITFERDLRNVLAAMSARKQKRSLEGEILGASDISEAIRHYASRDFGLGAEFPIVEKLLQIEEKENLLEKEFDLDKVRWNYIDQLNTFEYFTADILLGYLLKLFMLERWKPLDNADGLALLNNLISHLKTSFEFPKEFVLT
jgi:hypothetical protein